MNKIKFFTANTCASWIIAFVGYHREDMHVSLFVSNNRVVLTVFAQSPEDDIIDLVRKGIRENEIKYDRIKEEWLEKVEVMTLDIIWELS